MGPEHGPLGPLAIRAETNIKLKPGHYVWDKIVYYDILYVNRHFVKKFSTKSGSFLFCPKFTTSESNSAVNLPRLKSKLKDEREFQDGYK